MGVALESNFTVLQWHYKLIQIARMLKGIAIDQIENTTVLNSFSMFLEGGKNSPSILSLT
jgi:hypothetical protein